MRILLFGANGQVGHELMRSLAPLGRVTALDRAAADFSQPERLPAIIANCQPDVIVNAVAYTAVDKAESEPQLAETINATAPGILAAESDRIGATLVHYSTDYVFDGTNPGYYAEDDPANPLSVYGKTKLAGERAVARCARHLIFRTSWVFGTHGNNFARTMLRLAATRDALRVVDDQHGAPTSAATIADVTASALRLTLEQPQRLWGVYHVADAGETTWCGYARYLIQEASRRGLPLRAGAAGVHPISTAEYPTPARRPANSRLNTSRVRDTFGVLLPEWTRDVDRFLEHVISETA